MKIYIDLNEKVYGLQLTVHRKDKKTFILDESKIKLGAQIQENNSSLWEIHYRKTSAKESIVVIYSITETPIQNKRLLLELDNSFQIMDESIVIGNYKGEEVPYIFDQKTLSIRSLVRNQIINIPSGWSFISTNISSSQKVSELFPDVFIRDQEGNVFYKDRQDIDLLSPGKGYEIYTDKKLQIEIIEKEKTSENIEKDKNIDNENNSFNTSSYDYNKNWKWYGASDDNSIEDLMKDIYNIHILDGDKIYTKNNNRIIQSDFSVLKPGKGYKIYSN